jgi:Uma2 family endonuclease
MSTNLPPPSATDAILLLPELTPSLDDLITEDHKPVDRRYTEKLDRLLTETHYTNWAGPGLGRTFLVTFNVGWFYREITAAIVPDCMLSLDVACPDDLHTKRGHSYYQWIMGKPPEVAIEVVSNTKAEEDTAKKAEYAQIGVSYYAVLDPEHQLSEEVLRIWRRKGNDFERIEPGYWPEIGQGLVLWQGTFERHMDTWLRCCDAKGKVIPRAEERVRELEEALRRRTETLPDQPPVP